MTSHKKQEHRKQQNKKLKDLLVQFYKDIDAIEMTFKKTAKKIEHAHTKLMEKIARKSENAEKLLEGL